MNLADRSECIPDPPQDPDLLALLHTIDDISEMKPLFRIPVSRILVENIPFMKSAFSGVIEWHIHHKYYDEMGEKSDTVSSHFCLPNLFTDIIYRYLQEYYSASSVIRTSIIRILDYPNKPDGRLRHCKTCLRMRHLCRFSLFALFARLRTDRACEFYQGHDDAKTQEKGFKYKVSIVKQLKNSSVAITAERYGL